MKKALAGVLVASLLGLVATGAMAQVPYFQVYFDPGFQVTQSACGTASNPVDLYVVMHNFDPYPMAGCAFSLDLPASLLYSSDTPSSGFGLGTSPSAGGTGGISIGFGYGKLGEILACTTHCVWTGVCDCGAGPQPIVVRGYKFSQPGGTADPVGVTDETFENVPAVGMTSLICGLVPVESSTWGAVKALYR